MKKILVIKPDEDLINSGMFNVYYEYFYNCVMVGSPVLLPNNWSYEVVEVSEPWMKMSDEKPSHEVLKEYISKKRSEK